MQRNPGSCLYEYVESVPWRMDSFINSTYNESFKQEVNTICYAHIITMGPDVNGNATYSDCDIIDGRLRLLFNPQYLGTNISSTIENLPKRLNEAPQPLDTNGKVPTLSPLSRLSISTEFDAKIQPELEKVQKWFDPNFKLNPNWEYNYAVLMTSKEKDLDADWQSRIGFITLSYFEGFTYYCDYKGFKDDDMLQEGFNDAIDKHEVIFRVVDTLRKGSGYNECFIDDGVLYLQTTPKDFGVNTSQVAEELMDLL